MRAHALGSTVVIALLTFGTVIGAQAAEAKSAGTAVSLDGIAYRATVVDGVTRVEQVASERKVVLTLDEPLQLRLVEPGGQRLVLGTPLAKGADPYRPGGRASTRLVVADLTDGTSRAYDLRRNVEPDAFGVGNPTLFLVDHRPATNPTYYRVAALDLASGSFRALVGPNKLPLTVNMTGTARQQVASGSGQQLYTLYTQHAHTAARGNGHIETNAFVHVLDLTGGWAYCVDLPADFGHGGPRTSRIALDGTGTNVLVTDTGARKIAMIPIEQLSVSALAEQAPAVAILPLAADPRGGQ
jgi:hypothetical protein